MRFDSQFFSKDAIAANNRITERRHTRLGDISSRIESFGAYALTNQIDYIEEGHPFLRCVNIRDGFVEFANALFISDHSNVVLHKSEVKPGMVLMTMSGSVGRCAVALPEWNYPINSNQDIAKITLDRGTDPYFVVAFLNSRIGQSLVHRFPVGSVQQHIFLWQLQELPIPILAEAVVEKIGSIVRQSFDSRRFAEEKMAVAQHRLLTILELGDWHPPNPLSYEKPASEAFASGRYDAEFFHPRIDDLFHRLGDREQTISDVAKLRKWRFKPTTLKFNYLEIGAVSIDGVVEDSILDGADAPSRATWHVHRGDVLTSTVRPIRGLTAIVEDTQGGAVASSGFAVLEPTDISPELLLCYLKLPVICELMDLHTSASMYPAISVHDILNLPFKHPGKKAEQEIVELIQESRTKRRHSKALLERAKRAVEIAIEQDEETALAYLDGKHYVAGELLPKLFGISRHYVDLRQSKKLSKPRRSATSQRRFSATSTNGSPRGESSMPDAVGIPTCRRNLLLMPRSRSSIRCRNYSLTTSAARAHDLEHTGADAPLPSLADASCYLRDGGSRHLRTSCRRAPRCRASGGCASAGGSREKVHSRT